MLFWICLIRFLFHHFFKNGKFSFLLYSNLLFYTRFRKKWIYLLNFLWFYTTFLTTAALSPCFFINLALFLFKNINTIQILSRNFLLYYINVIIISFILQIKWIWLLIIVPLCHYKFIIISFLARFFKLLIFFTEFLNFIT